MTAENSGPDMPADAHVEKVETGEPTNEAEDRPEFPESQAREPETEGEVAGEPPETGPYTAPGAELEIEEIRERMRREFQSQKDREIQRERRRWEAELATLRNDGQQERPGSADTTKASEGRAGYESHLDALGATFLGLGGRLRGLPEMSDLEEADWNGLLGAGDFDKFVTGAVDLAAIRKDDAELREQAKDVAAADVKETLALKRSTQTAPDLMPPGLPAVGFDRIEERYVAGEIDIDRYRFARRRAGIQD